MEERPNGRRGCPMRSSITFLADREMLSVAPWFTSLAEVMRLALRQVGP